MFKAYETNRIGLLSGGPSTTAYLPLSKFISAEDIEKLKGALDRDLETTSGPQKELLQVQRAWLEDDSVPQIEIAFIPGQLTQAHSSLMQVTDEEYLR